MWNTFSENKERIERQYDQVCWIIESGETPEYMAKTIEQITSQGEAAGTPYSIIKAQSIAYVLDHAMLAVEPSELFQDHICHGFLVQKQREHWIQNAENTVTAKWVQIGKEAEALGIGAAHADFGHTVANWMDVLTLGFPGLLRRIKEAHEQRKASGEITQEQEAFYISGEIVYSAILRYVLRLAKATESYPALSEADRERLRYCADDLKAIASHEPITLHQALQLTYLYHILQEEIEGERLRSLGGVDRLYSRFMKHDTESGIATTEQLYEIWQDFFQKFHSLGKDTVYGEPLFLGGTLSNGECAVNEYTYLILRAYDSLKVANPKIHIRFSQDTPAAFIKEVLDCIRRGNSSFVFISDECTIPMMIKQVGATLEEARDYVPVGCYEPAICGREIPCTENGGLSLPKILELVLNQGVDPLSGKQMGIRFPSPDEFLTFDDLMTAVKQELLVTTSRLLKAIYEIEKQYMLMNPSPILSATFTECVSSGKDAYEGGAKYNNSSLCAYSVATIADSLAIIKKYVYEQKVFRLSEFNSILRSNWEGHELLRKQILKDACKWGNNCDVVDHIGVELCECFADIVNHTRNSRGGHFKAAMFSIDHNYPFGKLCGASADGRMNGEHLSRNCGATTSMDRKGVTALIESVTKLDFSLFPNGSVLDIMLHPTAVSGEEGLETFYQIIKTYFNLGGFAIHGNVMDADILKKAQQHPEQYKSLQVRVCGWNVYFVNLSKEEQDEFIKRAEG